jgi:hypothetical protein
MDELHELCVRVLGPGDAAAAAEDQVRRTGADDRMAILGAAVMACRARAADAAQPSPADGGGGGLAGTIAREMATATARLPEREREALALRELLGLSYGEIARVTGEDESTVAPVLAGARMGLRAELRGAAARQPACAERERALTTIALRQDGQAVSADDDDWLVEHLGLCRSCGQAHAAMLEAAACYRAWSPEPGDAPGAGSGSATTGTGTSA